MHNIIIVSNKQTVQVFLIDSPLAMPMQGCLLETTPPTIENNEVIERQVWKI
jgi:hypothetical protein